MTQRRGRLARATLAALLGLAAFGARAEPARYTLDPAHSWVQFEIVHFATSTMRGRIGPVEGTASLDREARRGELGVTIPVGSVSTGFPLFDTHLRGADLLDVATHPTAWFVARQFAFEGDALRSVRGEFTFRGVSSGLTLTARRFGCYLHPRLQREVCGGDFEGELQRSDFGLSYGLPFVADRVVLKLQVEAIRQD
ncbi:MAG TPA: YceI family protein [Methylibium sp.]|uniref:YceI family protein n=1 Tax=Methylibium sp. TaxID=2067992 RepID=UPI002DBCE1B3|nr:YceI family protein [Methylibium sp.]HEU4459004.1 YceI family protein [Methylibium sp.]